MNRTELTAEQAAALRSAEWEAEVDFIYNSAALAGNTLTKDEVRTILLAAKRKEKRDKE